MPYTIIDMQHAIILLSERADGLYHHGQRARTNKAISPDAQMRVSDTHARCRLEILMPYAAL